MGRTNRHESIPKKSFAQICVNKFDFNALPCCGLREVTLAFWKVIWVRRGGRYGGSPRRKKGARWPLSCYWFYDLLLEICKVIRGHRRPATGGTLTTRPISSLRFLGYFLCGPFKGRGSFRVISFEVVNITEHDLQEGDYPFRLCCIVEQIFQHRRNFNLAVECQS